MLSKLKVKYIQSLGQKKQRDREGVFIAEGPRLVEELLRSRKNDIQEIFALEEWTDENKSLLQGCDVSIVDETELGKISQLHTPNKVFAVLRYFPRELPGQLGNFVLALDQLQDPGNLGTIIRIADWFGVENILCSLDTADVYNPKVIQATMGSIARVNLYYTELTSWIQSRKDLRVYAAVLEGQDISKMKKPEAGIILIGNEARGISEELLSLANVRITIPRKGHAESLNAAVATGIILSHLV